MVDLPPASELQMLDAMYPGALLLDPPGWHEADDNLLPVSGTLQVDLDCGPPWTLQFSLGQGYPEDAAGLSAHVSCPEAGRTAGQSMAEWLQQVLSKGVADDAGSPPLTRLVEALHARLHEFDAENPAEMPATATAAAANVAAAAAEPVVPFALPPPAGHSGLVEGRVDRQWVTFVSFASSKIAREFAAVAFNLGLTGFLMVGKPGVACLEGGPKAMAAFLKAVRTDIFAQVDPCARKMTMSILEEACTRVRFEGFSIQDFTNAQHCSKGAAVDTGSESCSLMNKKRTSRTDLVQLKAFLLSRGIVERTFERVALGLLHDV